MPESTDVLIIGAGPTGLALALFLTRMHVRVRIVDTTTGPGTTSRATVLHARTLEFYRQAGVAHECVENGVEFAGLNLWVNGRHVTRAGFGELGEYLSRFSYVLVFPQDKQERMLVAALEKLGVRVERQTELMSFEQRDGGVVAQFRAANGTASTCRAAYIAGCDGAHSKVREQLRTGLPGGDYDDLFYVADIEGTGPAFNGEVNVALDDADFLVVFPMQPRGTGRLIGAVRRGAATGTEFEWKDVNARAIERLKVDVTKVSWFSTYRVHHRVAGAFRGGAAFLLGDAAHLHSPVGGQGMNTGIGDAMNLAWKLAGVVHGRIDPAVLDSYETERIAFARRLVATTDRAFAFVTERGRFARYVRTVVFPFVLPQLTRFLAFRRLMFMTISQLAIKYPASWLSEGDAGAVHAGDRLPWAAWRDADGTAHDNYEPFTSFDWQLHCYGEMLPAVRATCASRTIAVQEFGWRPEMKNAGLIRDAIYLVRPDAHVAFASAAPDAAALGRYLDQRRIRGAVPV
ncbi:MAG TPA: FAD-dependent monooxygenase [Gemmatimonadaceae bacterium]|jgi:2-polyprenyl-6-methoxyphenol hydroxylase-like FAD-dependent oxidoreductase